MLRLSLPLLTCLLIVAAGCNDGPSKPDPEPVTFGQVQQEVLVGSCGGAGCHNATTQAGGIDLEAVDALDQLLHAECEDELAVVEGLVRVAPGDPDRSFLYVKVTDPGGMGEPMPPFRALPDEQVELIRRWIEDGAEP